MENTEAHLKVCPGSTTGRRIPAHPPDAGHMKPVLAVVVRDEPERVAEPGKKAAKQGARHRDGTRASIRNVATLRTSSRSATLHTRRMRIYMRRKSTRFWRVFALADLLK